MRTCSASSGMDHGLNNSGPSDHPRSRKVSRRHQLSYCCSRAGSRIPIFQNCDSVCLSIAITWLLASIPLTMNKNDSRSALAEALKLALAGDHDPARLGNAIANPQRLTAIEKSAWVQLHNWSADANLRAQYPQIADFSRRRINELLVQLED